MLLSLYIENYALIDKLNIEFSEGFNVITGETGAGKSIIVGALTMILGERASVELIKSGKQKAILEAVFDVRNYQIDGYQEDEILIIGRELQVNGRNICKINGRIVTQSNLKEISKYLLDIHGQHQHQLLIDPQNHLKILDQFIEQKYLDNTKQSYEQWLVIKKEYDLLIKTKDLKQEEKDYYKYQLEELIAATLQKNEYTEIKEEKKRLENFNAIADVIKVLEGTAYQTMDNLQRNKNSLLKIADKENKLKSFLEQAESLEIGFEDFKNNIKEYEASLEFDQQRLDDLVERIDLYNSLKRKHLKQVSQDDDLGELLLQKQGEIEQILNNIEFSQERLQELEKQLNAAQQAYLDVAQELSAVRKLAAQELSQKIIKSLQELRMPGVEFEIAFGIKDEYSAKGIDEVEFMISPNPGEPVKSLVKIASGGEISRVMLAIKDVLLDKDLVSSMVFDEIDTGIGGDTANAIAQKIAAIARKHQVICITHLAQIASVADSHLLVSKEIESNKTVVKVAKLSPVQQETEIARMLSGKITEKTKAHAKELLEA